MKVRNGFVSNSSSSSFMIAIKKPQPCASCGCTPIDFLKELEIRIGDKKKEYEFFNQDIKEYIETLKYDIEELEKDRAWVLKEKELYATLLDDEKLAEGIQTFISLMQQLEEEKRTNKKDYRVNRYMGDNEASVMDVVKSQISSCSTYSINAEIKEATEKLEKLNSLNLDEKWTLFNIDIDNWEHGTKEAIELLLESKQAVLIKKENS